MSVRIASSKNVTLVNTNMPNATETIVLQTGALGLIQDNAQVLIHWYLIISVGVGATSVTIRIRRGTAVTSTLVNVAASSVVTASTQSTLSGCYVDNPGAAAGLQYTITGTVAGGAAAGTAGDGAIAAMVL